MDRRERLGDSLELLRASMQNAQAGLWTSIPGIVEAFDPVAMTCVVQPAIQGRYRAPDGTISLVTLPLLVDCPVIFPCGGGFTLTFPITAGDEALVYFASRCIDAWWQSGGVQAPLEFRMHDLSDGFCHVGPRSQPRVLSGVSTNSTQLRSDTGDCFVDVSPTTITLKAPDGSSLVLGGGKAQLHGSVEATIDGNGAGVSYKTSVVKTFLDTVPTDHSAPVPPGPIP